MDRNELLRERYNKIVKEFDLSHKWFSQTSGIAYGTIMSWKESRSYIGREKMDRVEELVSRFECFWD